MGYITSTKWIKHNITINWLNKNGFKYSKDYSSKEENAYTYAFPVYVYKSVPLLECSIVIYTAGEVIIRVLDTKTKEPYPQFTYDSQNNHKDLIEKIERVILKELKRLDIVPEYNIMKPIKRTIKYHKDKRIFSFYCPNCNNEIISDCKSCFICLQKLHSVMDVDYKIAIEEAYVYE